jgi:hypothetical protein
MRKPFSRGFKIVLLTLRVRCFPHAEREEYNFETAAYFFRATGSQRTASAIT